MLYQASSLTILSELVHCFAVSIPVGLLALTISKAANFRAFRTFVEERSEYWGEAVNCTFCTSFLVAAVAQFLTFGQVSISPLPWYIPVNAMAGWLSVVAFSSITSGLVYRMHATMAPVDAEPQSEASDQVGEQIELLTQVETWMKTNPSSQSAKAMVQIITGIPMVAADPATLFPKTHEEVAECKKALDAMPALRQYLLLVREASGGWENHVDLSL